MQIAIDGPSGAGKSTLAKMLAEKLGFVYIDTGAMYRTVALYCVKNSIDTSNFEAVVNALEKIDIKYTKDGQNMFLNGVNVTGEIRTPEISKGASAVAVIKEVRSFLVEIQRNMAKKTDVIMDGRDIGTNVLPDAEIKIFLTASAKSRAMRRYKELVEKGIKTEFDTILDDMIKRDKNDSERECAPLRAAEDAIVVDTTEYNLEESFEVLLKTIKENGGEINV